MPKLIFSQCNPYQNDNDALTWIGNNFFLYDKAVFSDEYGYLNRYSKWKFNKKILPIPQPIMKGNKQEFEDILLEELEHLRNKRFALMYSGGVDSTTILVSLLKLRITDFTLVYSDSSIKEYPLMFSLINQYPNIRYVRIDKNNYRETCNDIMKDNIMMAGCHADKLFTSNFRNHWDAFSYNNWKDFMKTKANSDIIDMFDESFKFYGLNVITPIQFFFWLSFSITRVFGNPFLLLQSMPNGKNYYCPYSNKKFLNWAMSRFDDLKTCVSDNPLNYKVEMKEIIRDFTKDNDYFNTKLKVRSIRKMVEENKVGFFIIDSKGIYNFKEEIPNAIKIMERITEKYRYDM